MSSPSIDSSTSHSLLRRAFSATVAGNPVMNSSRVTWALVLFVSLALGAACRSAEPQPEPSPADAAKPAPIAPAPGPGPSAARTDDTPQSQAQGPGFQEQTQEARLRQERNAFLVDRHVTNARRWLSAGALEQARDEVEAAMKLAPADPTVLQLRNEIASLLGEKGPSMGVSLDEIETRERLRADKARMEAEQGLLRGRELAAMKEFDRSLSEIDHVSDLIRWSPYATEWADLANQAKELRARVESEKKADEELRRREREQQALVKMRDEEAAAKARRAEAIAAKLTMALDAFNANDYRGARQIAESVLAEDPRNERAQDLRDAAENAEEKRVDDNFLRARREAYRRLKRDDLETRTMYTATLTLPSAEFWDTISKLRDPKVNLEVVEGESEDSRIVREMLRTKTIPSVKIEGETSLEAVIGYLRNATGIPMQVSPAANEKVAGGTTFRIELPHQIKAEAALKLVLASAPDLTYVIKEGIVLITTTEQALGSPITRAHDVSDLIFGLTNFQGPRLNQLSLPGGARRGGGGGGGGEENVYGAVLDRVVPIPAEEITNLIKETIAPGTWEQQGVKIDQYQGQLIVTHSLEVQRQIYTFLADLRRYSSSLVTIEARFLTVSENFLQVIGVDWRGLPQNFDDVTNGLKDNASAGLDNNGTGIPSNAGGTPSAGAFFDNGTDGSVMIRTENLFGRNIGSKLTETGGLALEVTILKGSQASMILRAVEKNLDVHEVNAQMLSVAAGQRSYITVVNQQSYIADYDVEVAQASFIAEPKIGILQSGVVLDVKPIIHYDRKYMTLELQPTVARVVSLTDFTTTLGGLAGAVTFQLPQLLVQSAFTTAVVPDGGAVLIGGLKTLREVEARAEVPWLGRLPIVGFFFKKEGYDSENENLMILIRAQIADAREAMRKFEASQKR